MDHDEDRKNDVGIPSPNFQMKNQETYEKEQVEELFASGEESDDSVGKVSSDKSSSDKTLIDYSPIPSDIFDLNEEEPSTLDILSTEDPPCTVYSSSNSKTTSESGSSLSDLPSESTISSQPTSPPSSQIPTEEPTCARKLNFRSDTSNDESKLSTIMGSSVRKFSETDENQSTVPKIGNDKNVSENPHLSPSSKISDEISKAKESEQVSNPLVSSETMNSEISETNQSSRKRLISDAKSSDSDEADVKSKNNKKLKQSDSSDKETS